MDLKPEITWQDFEKLDIRCGTVISVADFPEAKKPSYRLEIDFGTLGIKKSLLKLLHFTKKKNLLASRFWL